MLAILFVGFGDKNYDGKCDFLMRTKIKKLSDRNKTKKKKKTPYRVGFSHTARTSYKIIVHDCTKREYLKYKYYYSIKL